MKTVKIINLSILLSIFYLSSCTPTIQMLLEPIKEKNLLIGSLILDIDGYRDEFLTIREGIEVVIVGRIFNNGRFQSFGQWATTDENGYFFIANVFDGEFAIKGFRIHISGIGDIIISNELTDPQRNYYELNVHDSIFFSGNIFDIKPYHRVVNFKHNIFTLNRDEIIHFSRYEKLKEKKLSTGEIVNSPSVPNYFYEKYSETGWNKFLQLLF